jgi:hypothetical protein
MFEGNQMSELLVKNKVLTLGDGSISTVFVVEETPLHYLRRVSYCRRK